MVHNIIGVLAGVVLAWVITGTFSWAALAVAAAGVALIHLAVRWCIRWSFRK